MMLALCGHCDTGDLSPDRKRFGAGSPVLDGGEMIAAELEEVLIGSGTERNRCAWPGGLDRFICRSRRHVGWCEFSARLFRPLCRRCSTLGISSSFAAG